jgi:hypothetical protein
VMIKLRFPTWIRALSNRALIDRFCAAERARGPEEDPNVHRLLDLLGDEISQREQAAMLTDEDWKRSRNLV